MKYGLTMASAGLAGDARMMGSSDIPVGGSPRGDDWEKERTHIRAVGEAGVTWWVECVPPEMGDFEVLKKLVGRGPLSVD